MTLIAVLTATALPERLLLPCSPSNALVFTSTDYSCSTFYQPIWFFANVEAGTATQNVSDSFLCFDLDLNAAAETHPADVTSWGLTIDGSTTASRTCEFATTCGCQVDDDDENVDDEEAADDAGSEDGDTSNAAFSITTTTTTSGSIALVAGSAFMLAVNGARP